MTLPPASVKIRGLIIGTTINKRTTHERRNPKPPVFPRYAWGTIAGSISNAIPGVSCFTLCCRGINIILTPYDIIQLKNRLDLSSHDFLAIYTEPHLLEKTDLPMVTLKLLDDDRESCPFVKDKQGCIIYEDRPTSCRYYPLGVATLQHKEGADNEGFFFLCQ